MDIATVEQPRQEAKLPSGFKEVKHSGEFLTLSPDQIPWLDKDKSIRVPLVKVTLAGTNGKSFFMGSAIEGEKLKDAARKLTPSQSDSVNQLLYTHVPDLIEHNHSNFVSKVDKAITKKNPILCFSNKGGQRVYFMRFEIDGVQTIIKIAACDKSEQANVFSVITDQNHRQIKYRGRL